MISMFPLKISSFLERAPLPQASVGPMRPRLAAAESPTLAPAQALMPEQDRRVNGKRRSLERRGSEQATMLDTRTPQGRRRNPGRRAEDRQEQGARMAISVKA
jgi:hypothetical protein